MKNYFLLLALAATVGFTSCGKDDDDVAPTKTELLTSKTWMLSERVQVTTDSSGTTTNSTILACEKDDTYKFTTDNKYTRDEGATKCDPSDPQTEAGSWVFTDNETKLAVTSGNFTLPAEIIELTSSKMVVRSTLDFFGDQIVATNTFIAQ